MLPKHADSPNGLIITRVMANNQNYLADPQGDFDDWIELTNAGQQPVELRLQAPEAALYYSVY